MFTRLQQCFLVVMIGVAQIGLLGAEETYLQADPSEPIEPVHGASHSPLTDSYACDLRVVTNQCREYEVLDNAKNTLKELSDGCVSMGGRFSPEQCSEQLRLFICTDIIRNYHQPDVIYSNSYYDSAEGQWQEENTKRVCGDLGGEFFAF